MRFLIGCAPVMRSFILAALVFGGCRTTSPRGTIGAYLDAIEDHDGAAAYSLLDENTQANVTPSEFTELMNANRSELAEEHTALERGLARDSSLRATIRLRNGESIALTHERGGWRLGGDVLGYPGLASPEEAVQALRRALARRDLALVFRLLARERRAELDADIQVILRETEDDLSLEFDVRGDQARVRTPSGRAFQLVRENGEWHIVDILER